MKDAESLTLTFRGEIDPDYDVNPERLVFGDARPLVQRVVLKPRHIPELKVTGVVSDKRFFTARVVPAAGNDESCVEIAYLPREFWPDSGPSEVRVYTDSKRDSTVFIPLEVKRTSDASAAEPKPEEVKP